MQPFVIFKPNTPTDVMARHMLAINARVMARMPKPKPNTVTIGPVVGWVVGDPKPTKMEVGPAIGFVFRKNSNG
jgi:hypothetical protein